MNLLRKLFNRLRTPGPHPTLSSQAAYARWATQYPARAHNALMEAEAEAMHSLMPALDNKIVLDLGCGTGRWGLSAVQSGAQQVVGLDTSRTMLKNGELSTVVQATLDAIPLPAAMFDVILCGLVIGHLPKFRMERSFKEIARVLAPHGTILISDFHPFQAWQGAQRTFQDGDGTTYAVEHYPYSYADFHEAAARAELQITGVREPTLILPSAQRDVKPMPVAIVLRLEHH